MQNNDTKPVAEYELNDGEIAVMQSLNVQALNAKATVFDLQSQLEVARKELANAQSAFAGALQVMANAHGMSRVQISPDLKKITQA